MGFFDEMTSVQAVQNTDDNIIEGASDDELDEMPDDVYSDDSNNEDYASINPDDYMAVDNDDDDDDEDDDYEDFEEEDEGSDDEDTPTDTSDEGRLVEELTEIAAQMDEDPEPVKEKPKKEPPVKKEHRKLEKERGEHIQIDANRVLMRDLNIKIGSLKTQLFDVFDDIQIEFCRVNADSIEGDTIAIYGDSIIVSNLKCTKKLVIEGNVAIKGNIEAPEIYLYGNVQIKGDIRGKLSTGSNDIVKINGACYYEDEIDESVFEE